MLLSGDNIAKTWLFLTVLATWIVAFGDTIQSDDSRTVNLKFGFDLTQGENGAPSLRIRDFEDTDFNRRAVDEDKHGPKRTIKDAKRGVDSLNDSEGDIDSDYDRTKEEVNKPKYNRDDDFSGNNRIKSTRGIKPDEFEPEEEHPKIHPKLQHSDRERYSESENSNISS